MDQGEFVQPEHLIQFIYLKNNFMQHLIGTDVAFVFLYSR